MLSLLTSLTLSVGTPPPDVLQVSATMTELSAKAGRFQVILEVKDGWQPTDLKFSALLQVDVPESVKLAGKVLTTQKDLSSNGYVREPFERIVGDGPTTVEFTLRKTPGPKRPAEQKGCTWRLTAP